MRCMSFQVLVVIMSFMIFTETAMARPSGTAKSGKNNRPHNEHGGSSDESNNGDNSSGNKASEKGSQGSKKSKHNDKAPNGGDGGKQPELYANIPQVAALKEQAAIAANEVKAPRNVMQPELIATRQQSMGHHGGLTRGSLTFCPTCHYTCQYSCVPLFGHISISSVTSYCYCI